MFKSVLDLLDKKLEDSKARKSIALNVSNTISRKFIGNGSFPSLIRIFTNINFWHVPNVLFVGDSVKPGAVDDEESDENDQKNGKTNLYIALLTLLLIM